MKQPHATPEPRVVDPLLWGQADNPFILGKTMGRVNGLSGQGPVAGHSLRTPEQQHYKLDTLLKLEGPGRQMFGGGVDTDSKHRFL